MATKIFESLVRNKAKIFATAIPREIQKPETRVADEFLRKDLVFLLERFFYFLEERNDDGLLILDATERHEDKRFVKRLEEYFKKTTNGKERQKRIVPSPFFGYGLPHPSSGSLYLLLELGIQTTQCWNECRNSTGNFRQL